LRVVVRAAVGAALEGQELEAAARAVARVARAAAVV
jgi:hypothetical protein